MDLRYLIYIFALITGMVGCGTLETWRHGGGDLSSTLAATATMGDMMNVLGNRINSEPYSRYLYRVTGTDGKEAASGVISIAQGGDENMKLTVAGSELKVVPEGSFRQRYGLSENGLDRVPLSGGYMWGNKLALMPGLYVPVELHPLWFPSNAAVSVDRKGNLLVRLKKKYVNETEGLVAFMDIHHRLEGLTCKVLGTFDTVPQLKKLVAKLRSEGKYNGDQYYVLRLSWSDTFALVIITREREKP